MPITNTTSLHQSSRAHPVPSLAPSEETQSSHTESLVDVDSPHISSVPSDYQDQAIKTETQATRLEHEAEDDARRASRKAADAAEKAKQKAAAKAKELKSEAKKEGKKLSDNRDNPVVVGNAVIWGIGIVAIAAAGYQRHQEGKLDWPTVGTVAGAVAAFSVADYYGSKYVLILADLLMLWRSATWTNC